MPQLAASWTIPQLQRLTRGAFLQRFLRETALGDYGVATGGSTSTIVDTTKLQSSQYNSDQWVGGWARISFDAGGAAAAPEGSISPITTYGPTTGTITFNPTMTAPAVGDFYELWRYPDPQTVLDMLDNLLTESWAGPHWTMLTEVPDGDMEQNNTTDWTAANATVTKQTAEPSMGPGLRRLRVAATADNGYARSNLLAVEPNQVFCCSALARAITGNAIASLVVFDENAGVALTPTSGAVTTSRFHPTRIWGQWQMPSTPTEISVRLTTTLDTESTEWKDIAGYISGSRDIALPWWVKHENQVKAVFKLEPKTLDGNTWDAAYVGTRTSRWNFQPQSIGKGQLRLWSQSEQLGGRPLYILGQRNELAFSNDNTDVRHIDEDWLIAGLAYKVFSRMAVSGQAGVFDMAWVREQRDRWQRTWEEEEAYQDSLWVQLMQEPRGDTYVNTAGGRR